MSDLFGESLAPVASANPAVPRRYALIAPERGVDLSGQGLAYAIPSALSDLQPGERVQVPLGRGNQTVAGFVMQVDVPCELDPSKVKAIVQRDGQSLRLPGDLVELARWLAGYYCCPLGMTFASILPAAVKQGVGRTLRPYVELIADAPRTGVKLSPLQQRVLDALEAAGRGDAEVDDAGDADEPRAPVGAMDMRKLADRAGARTVAPVRQLVEKGLLRLKQVSQVQAQWDDLGAVEIGAASRQVELNPEQASAVDAVLAQRDAGFRVHLLRGVTGSGKTEVYLQLIARLLENGGKPLEPGAGVIVLVPEIALTPQTVYRFRKRFGEVAVLHSALTPAQRHEQWQRIAAGQARIVIGARSAIFAPLSRPLLIVVDEEHDSSYKQDQAPRYHARDVAVRRAQLLNIPVVLGSATPSLESYHNATWMGSRGTDQPRYNLLEITQRVAGSQLPQVQLVDMVEERRARRGVHLISRRLETLLAHTLRQKGQAIFLLNRRGYANYIACPDHNCGWIMGCPHCDVTVVYHRDGKLPTGGFVRCHHCDGEQLLPQFCPSCHKKVTLFGLGTQRVEEELATKFPEVKVQRMDSDAMRSRQQYQQSLLAFQRGEVEVLLGTQMIAKGLDFPNVKLVGVISGDTALNLPDFRASERTFQLIAQVAGRAGRASEPGVVVVQTFSIHDPTIQLAAQHDYETFARQELAVRAQVGLPPLARMARLVVRDRDPARCVEYARTLAGQLTAANQRLALRVRMKGPMACPIARVADYHRQQIELIAPPPEAASSLQKLLASLRSQRLLVSDARTAVDVDPISLL